MPGPVSLRILLLAGTWTLFFFVARIKTTAAVSVTNSRRLCKYVSKEVMTTLGRLSAPCSRERASERVCERVRERVCTGFLCLIYLCVYVIGWPVV